MIRPLPPGPDKVKCSGNFNIVREVCFSKGIQGLMHTMSPAIIQRF